jgi:hypothetical protein
MRLFCLQRTKAGQQPQTAEQRQPDFFMELM